MPVMLRRQEARGERPEATRWRKLCFPSRLSPLASRLLFEHIRRILRRAIASQGTTFRDYRTGTGESGNFQLELLVYGREGEPCRVCGTRLSHTHDIDGRITVFCHKCQR